MVPGRPNLGEILVKSGCISQEQFEKALKLQVSTGSRFGETLVALKYCSDEDLARALSAQLDVPFVDLDEHPPSPECVALLPREIALEYEILPVSLSAGKLLVAVADPTDIEVDDVVRATTEMQVSVAVAPEGQLRKLLDQFYGGFAGEARTEVIGGREEVEEERATPLPELTAAREQIPTIRLVNMILADAILKRASDIHLEPAETDVRVRYRVDGELHTVLTLDRSRLQSAVCRIKIMAGMDISESRKPQDGGTYTRVQDRKYELRVSTLPTIYGEKVVIRILLPSATLIDLDHLGMEPAALADFRRQLARRQGIILLTGPTGSGKTTTLYAVLNELNRDNVNIVTVEDPVEIKLPGANQVAVSEKSGRTYASTLRAMLRQDPNVIMVGEIRDLETAEIACRAALTGHLVLSTLHTQDSLGSLWRLMDMGVPAYIVAASLNASIAQRLVRRVCDHCAEAYDPPATLKQALKARFGSLEDARFRRGVGCPECNHSGMRGRLGVYEMLLIDEELRHMIGGAAPPDAILRYIRMAGLVTLERDAFAKACQGVIPPEEVVRLGLGLAVQLEETENVSLRGRTVPLSPGPPRELTAAR